MGNSKITELKELLDNGGFEYEFHDDFGGYLYCPKRSDDETYCLVVNDNTISKGKLAASIRGAECIRDLTPLEVYQMILENIAKVEEKQELSNREIKDSGTRRKFETGAVRDMAKGKGRFDLMPLDVMYNYASEFNYFTEEQANFIREINDYQNTKKETFLYYAMNLFIEMAYMGDFAKAMLDVSKQFEDGAIKYGENNWQKGIPVKCYIDSTLRHYFKWINGWDDEPHDRATLWNLLCGIWTIENEVAQ